MFHIGNLQAGGSIVLAPLPLLTVANPRFPKPAQPLCNGSDAKSKTNGTTLPWGIHTKTPSIPLRLLGPWKLVGLLCLHPPTWPISGPDSSSILRRALSCRWVLYGCRLARSVHTIWSSLLLFSPQAFDRRRICLTLEIRRIFYQSYQLQKQDIKRR